MAGRSERARRAFAHLPEVDPALAALALWTRAEDAAGETRTEGGAILIGEAFEGLPLREQVGLLGHHVLHAAFRHDARMAAMAARLGGAFDRRLYNLAADAVTNSILEAGGHAPPRPAVTLAGLLAASRIDEPADLAAWDVDRLYVALAALSSDGAAGRDGYMKAKAFRPDLEPGEGATPEEGQGAWRSRLARAASGAGAAGRGIGPLLARLAGAADAGTPWELRLRRLLALATSSAPRVSHRRPRRGWIAAEAEARRRGGPRPVFEPGTARDGRRPRIVVGVDSSGSVADDQLALFAAEVAGVARRTGAETHALLFDDEVYARIEVAEGDLRGALDGAEVRRGGGTAFVDVIEKAAALDPSIIVVLTDLDGAFGPPPRRRVVWATPLPTWAAPPFGEVLSLAR